MLCVVEEMDLFYKLKLLRERPESISTKYVIFALAEPLPPRDVKFKVILQNLTKG